MVNFCHLYLNRKIQQNKLTIEFSCEIFGINRPSHLQAFLWIFSDFWKCWLVNDKLVFRLKSLMNWNGKSFFKLMHSSCRTHFDSWTTVCLHASSPPLNLKTKKSTPYTWMRRSIHQQQQQPLFASTTLFEFERELHTYSSSLQGSRQIRPPRFNTKSWKKWSAPVTSPNDFRWVNCISGCHFYLNVRPSNEITTFCVCNSCFFRQLARKLWKCILHRINIQTKKGPAFIFRDIHV